MASSNPTASPAPWKSLFLEHVSKQEDPYMAVATVERDPKSGSSIPRVRYCGFRGFFGDLKLHHSAEKQLKEENGLNPSLYESDLLAFTTDVRMQKIEQFGDFEGAIEVVFWVKELMAQWRLRGKAFVIGDDANKSAERESRSEIAKALRRKPNHSDDSEASAENWTWEKEVTAYFANHSPIMRGMHTMPAPALLLGDD
jgi:pyridoxamine 5'-phosphate oxidase